MSARRWNRRARHAPRLGALAAIVVAFASVGCRAEKEPERALVVFAAASLREPFTALAATFEQRHPGVEVTLSFAGTQELRTQLEHGAAADVLASADVRHMDALVAAKRVRTPIVFVRNGLVVVVAPDAAARVRDLGELPTLERIVVGAREVPVGRYAEQLFTRAAQRYGGDYPARVAAKIVSRELNVRQVLAKVSLGEAQAGVVYRTDAKAAKGVVTVDVPAELDVLAEYPIAVVEGAAHPALAAAWLELVTSAEGQRALADAGFTPVTPRASATSTATRSSAATPRGPGAR
ncbi:molybdate ABC transporter substrate-binding protein [Myxococcota bacterium]|nr:molybdate ABC transporter substrate-binding protein [Myxococcota bacterium]